MKVIMLRRFIAFIALLAMGSTVSAQVNGRGYPSLGKRPVETRDRTLPPPVPVEAAASDPTLVDQIARLAQQAASGDSAFQRLIARSRSTVQAARGAAPVSEAWIAGQMAISTLDSARYDSVAALAGLDTLFVERQNMDDAGRVKADIAAIDPVRLRTLAMVDAQNDALDALRLLLPLP